jgi:hypothetical protein
MIFIGKSGIRLIAALLSVLPPPSEAEDAPATGFPSIAPVALGGLTLATTMAIIKKTVVLNNVVNHVHVSGSQDINAGIHMKASVVPTHNIRPRLLAF